MIKLEKHAHQQMRDKLQTYFIEQLDIELGQFDAEFLVDFISEHCGHHYYNQGLTDARKVVSSHLSQIADNIDEQLYTNEAATPSA